MNTINTQKFLSDEILRVTTAGIVIGSNIALMIFLFSEPNFLVSNSFFHMYFYNWIRWALLIDTLILYLYIASVGILANHNQTTPRFSYEELANGWYKTFYYRGMTFAFYTFTFSLFAYIGGLIAAYYSIAH